MLTTTTPKTLKLFIADDSDILRNNLADMLSEIDGCKIVGEADDGINAIAGIHETDPDLLILDIRMPGADGFDVLQETKKRLPETKVIMFSNHSYIQYRQRCTDLGADYFFEKSGGINELINTVEALVQKQRLM